MFNIGDTVTFKGSIGQFSSSAKQPEKTVGIILSNDNLLTGIKILNNPVFDEDRIYSFVNTKKVLKTVKKISTAKFIEILQNNP